MMYPPPPYGYPSPRRNEELLAAARKSWDELFNPPPLLMGVEDGVVWAIVPSPVVGVNGYCMIPAEGHPWSPGFPPDDLDDFLDAHGGITYSSHPWVGFDCAHFQDIWPPEYDPYEVTRIAREYCSTWSSEWTPELVIEEAKKLARQIAEIGALEKQIGIQMEEK
jgi:hypothetical protein